MNTLGKILFIIGIVFLIAITFAALYSCVDFFLCGEIIYGIACGIASIITGYSTFLMYDNYQHKIEL